MSNLGIAKFNAAFNGGEAATSDTEKPVSKMNKGELQALCKAKGLDDQGTVKELKERLAA